MVIEDMGQTTKTHILGGVVPMKTHNEGKCAKDCWCHTRKGRLNGLATYLCGPIDHADDDGVGWRRKITEDMKDMFGVRVLDPTDKPCKTNDGSSYEEIGEEKVSTMQLKKDGHYAELAEKMRNIVRVDLRMVDLSDFIITYLPKDVTVCGTIHEIVTATESKKPTLIVAEGGRANIPNWLWGMLPVEPHTENRSGWLFDDFDALMEYLRQVHMGDAPEPKTSRWVFMDSEVLRG